MGRHNCKKCGAGLCSDEIALHKKLYGRAIDSYFCLDCQAEYLRTTREKLEETIDRLKQSGTCVLFARADS